MSATYTPGPWRTEAVSDAVRVVVGAGRQKIILARCNPKQIPEAETAANARLMAAASRLLIELCESRRLLQQCADDAVGTPSHDLFAARVRHCDAAIASATGATPGEAPAR